jgi:integral membrane protein
VFLVLSSTVGRFRAIAFIEGLSFLVLLLIAMPIKYLGDNPDPVRYTGWVHGVLYVLYAIAGFQAMAARKWPWTEAVRGFVASIIPAGTFVYDWAFLKGDYAAEQAAKQT